MTFDNNFNSITMPALMKKVMDTVTKTNVLAGMVLSNPKVWNGRTMDKAIQVVAPTNGGSFAGFDLLDTSLQPTKQKLSFDPRFYYQAVVISGTERDVAGVDKNAAVNYVAEMTEEAANAMAGGVGTALYTDGTGNSSKDFLGLKAIADDGTVTPTYGGLARATYTTIQATRTAVGAGLTSLAPIYTAINATERYSSSLSSDKKIILTTRALWTSIESLLQPTLVNNMNADGYKQVTRDGSEIANRAGLKGEIGYNAIYVRGIPVIADEKCTANYLYVLTMDYLSWYGMQDVPEGFRAINFGGNTEVEGYNADMPAKNFGAIFSNFITPTNQYGQVAHIFLRGNMLSFSPNRHAVNIYT